jgi:Tfp pilus assembly protein PilV
LASAAARAARKDGGFLMIEVLVAVLVLAVGIGATFELLIATTHATSTDRVRQAETSVARELAEDARTLAYTQLTPSAIASNIQPLVSGSAASGSTLTVTRGTSPDAVYTFNATFASCSMDDPADGIGNHSSPPASGGSWCPDVAANGTTDSQPDDYKRITITVSPVGGRVTTTTQYTFLIYNEPVHAPAVSCLSVTTTCPGTNVSYSSGTQVTFNVSTTQPAASIEWLVNGSVPPSSQLPSGGTDPYTPTGSTSSFTWVLPSVDGTYTIAALAYDTNGNAGTKTSLQVTVNLHQAIAPTSVTAGWNHQIGGVDIQWVPSVDQDILYYDVYSQYGTNSPTLVCSAVKGTSCYDLTAPSPEPEPATCTSSAQSFTTSNLYWVVGVDTNPVTGQPRVSTAKSPAVDANLCDHPPSAPTNLAGTLSNGQLTLTWSAPTDPDSWDSIEYWRIYRWTGSGGPSFPGGRYDLVGAVDSSGTQTTTYTDQAPDPGGVQQNYCVTAVDTHLNESPCSSAVTG